MVTGELVYAVIYHVDPDALAEKGSLIREKERPEATSHHEAQTGFMLLMATINQCAIKTALSLSPITDALTLAAEKCFGQRFGCTCTKQER